MKALLLEEYGELIVTEVPAPSPGPREVLVRVKSVGICGSDVHGYDGGSGRRIPPLIMGHEAAGEIHKVGSRVSAWQPGDRVTFDSTIYRLDDWFSRRGWYNLSDKRRVLGVSCDEYRQNGAFAEYVVVPEHILYRLPDSLSFDHAALTEPLAVALHGVSLTPISFGDTVAVIGAGLIGLLVIAALRHSGCADIVAADLVDARLEMARRMGATATVNPQHQRPSQVCAELSDGRGADAAIEAVGLQVTVRDAVESVRRGGTVTILGNIAASVELPLQRIVAGQIRIQGSCAISGEYPAAIRMLADGAVPAEQLISRRATLQEAAALFKQLRGGDPALFKVIMQP